MLLRESCAKLFLTCASLMFFLCKSFEIHTTTIPSVHKSGLSGGERKRVPSSFSHKSCGKWRKNGKYMPRSVEN